MVFFQGSTIFAVANKYCDEEKRNPVVIIKMIVLAYRVNINWSEWKIKIIKSL